MARKRLYGETQKRRQKKQTQELKRRNSVTRVQSTHQPAPFQRQGEVNSQDIAFMEAMHDMGVEHYPRAGEAPVRQEKFESVRFAATNEDENSFLATMENLGVRPMSGKIKGRPSRPGGVAEAGKSSHEAVAHAAAASEGAEPPHAQGGQGIAGRPLALATLPGKAQEQVQEKAQGKTQASPQPEDEPAREAMPQRKYAATTFQLDEDDAEMMAEALREEEFDPKAKFEGAPPPPQAKRPEPVAREDSEQEPDAELDLHGKTLEESIRMVQNFLLTSYHRKLRHVLIITGKGHNSGAAGPVLREAVFNWLERNGERFSKSFAWAPSRHGGEGAIWVVLR